MKTKKLSMVLILSMLLVLLSGITALAAATFSNAWYQSGDTWFIKGPGGEKITNAWVCDDAIPGNGQNVWYLIDAGGNMVTAPLVQDGTGNYYSIETSHNGYYGMLRYQSGTYDGIYLNLSQRHDGSFGAIQNQDAINALRSRYGLYNVAHISNKNCVYTSTYAGGGTSETYTINYYAYGSRYTTKKKQSRSMTIMSDTPGRNFDYWEEASTGDRYYPGDEYYFNGSKTSTRLNAVFKEEAEYYTLNYYSDDRFYTSQESHTGRITVLAAPESDVVGRQFAGWEDELGNIWQPGEVYTFHDKSDYMTAVWRSLTGPAN